MGEVLIKAEDITAVVRLNNGEDLTTVDHVSLELCRGRSYAIAGKSGSGKTSLISVLGLLNLSFEGHLYYKNTSIKSLKDKELSRLRGKNIGFVFQNYSLIKHLKVWENVELPLLYAKLGRSKKECRQRIQEVLSVVGLEKRESDYPNNLSGGEQQRVAIARALATSPEMLICDEPTGALDKKTGESVMSILFDAVKKEGATLVLVTHDPAIADNCDTIMHMDEGKIIDVSHDV